MAEIETLRGQKIKVDKRDFTIAENYVWSLSGTKEEGKYPVTRINGKSITFSKVVFGINSNEAIYHKNKDPFDYRRKNIIICSRRVFGYLTSIDKKSKDTDCYGVIKLGNAWVLRLRQESGRVLEERYYNKKDAAMAADYHAVQNYGELAKRNCPNMTFNELEEQYILLRQNAEQAKKKHLSQRQQGLPKPQQGSKSSKYVGVTWDSNKNKWSSSITHMRKNISLGNYSSEKDAAVVYDKKALVLFGDDAKRNFPEIPACEIDGLFNAVQTERNRLTLTEKLSKSNQGIKKPRFNWKTSQYVGVSLNSKRQMWTAQITYLNDNNQIGLFEKEEEAAIAYDRKALELFGPEARLNFPKNIK